MPSYKITIDDECLAHLEEQRAKVKEAVVAQATAGIAPPPPWFAGYLEDVPNYILYLTLDHCRVIERTKVSEAKSQEMQEAVATADAHITTVTASAEELS